MLLNSRPRQSRGFKWLRAKTSRWSYQAAKLELYEKLVATNPAVERKGAKLHVDGATASGGSLALSGLPRRLAAPDPFFYASENLRPFEKPVTPTRRDAEVRAVRVGVMQAMLVRTENQSETL